MRKRENENPYLRLSTLQYVFIGIYNRFRALCNTCVDGTYKHEYTVCCPVTSTYTHTTGTRFNLIVDLHDEQLPLQFFIHTRATERIQCHTHQHKPAHTHARTASINERCTHFHSWNLAHLVHTFPCTHTLTHSFVLAYPYTAYRERLARTHAHITKRTQPT